MFEYQRTTSFFCFICGEFYGLSVFFRIFVHNFILSFRKHLHSCLRFFFTKKIVLNSMKIYRYKLSSRLWVVLIVFFLASCQNETKNKSSNVAPKPKVKPVEKIFSYIKDDYIIQQDTIRKFDTFGEIMNKYHLPYADIYKITNKIKDSFDIKKIKLGKAYMILSQKDSLDSLSLPKVFIYQHNPIDYTIIDLQDSIEVRKIKKPVKLVRKKAKVVIENSLYQDIADNNLSPKLAMELSNIYAWTVDFFHLNKGDRFKAIYDDKYIDDSIYTGVGTIYAAKFTYGGRDFYAFRYPTDSLGNNFDYFDEKGATLRKQFLKAPIKFGHISSRYNLHRFIKFYGRVKPHLGTDFAAPIGTPIMATANGTVIKRGYTSGNGNYIKIKHNATYSTQYLHMSKFAKGIHVGSVVKQGEVIGYIGMTGHASGPHVCYRFWKNGKQVDALKEKMPPAKPIAPTIKERYLKDIANIKKELDSL